VSRSAGGWPRSVCRPSWSLGRLRKPTTVVFLCARTTRRTSPPWSLLARAGHRYDMGPVHQRAGVACHYLSAPVVARWLGFAVCPRSVPGRVKQSSARRGQAGRWWTSPNRRRSRPCPSGPVNRPAPSVTMTCNARRPPRLHDRLAATSSAPSAPSSAARSPRTPRLPDTLPPRRVGRSRVGPAPRADIRVDDSPSSIRPLRDTEIRRGSLHRSNSRATAAGRPPSFARARTLATPTVLDTAHHHAIRVARPVRHAGVLRPVHRVDQAMSVLPEEPPFLAGYPVTRPCGSRAVPVSGPPRAKSASGRDSSRAFVYFQVVRANRRL